MCLTNIYKNKELVISISIILTIVVCATLFSGKIFIDFFERQSDKSFKPLDSIYVLNRSLLETNSKLSDTQKGLLLRKAEVIEQNKNHHKIIFVKLYSNYYAAVTLFAILSGITVILSFLIAQNGWKQCKPILKALFLTIVFLSALYGLFPTIYKQNETSYKNLDNYLKYNKIQKQIFDYAITAPYLYSDSLDFSQFINNINEEELEISNIYFGLEQKSINQDILENIK